MNQQMKRINLVRNTPKFNSFLKYLFVIILVVFFVKFSSDETSFYISITKKSLLITFFTILSLVATVLLRKLVRKFLTNRKLRKQGYIKCDNCDGVGWVPSFKNPWWLRMYKKNQIYSRCQTCNGTGKIDWVTNIVRETSGESII